MTYRFRNEALRITATQAGNLTYYVVEDPERDVRHRLYELEYAVAKLLDGRRTLDKVVKLLEKQHGHRAESVDVQSFAAQLLALGFVEAL